MRRVKGGAEGVMAAWANGEEGRAGNMWTDGVTVYSYGTAILTPLIEGTPCVLNATQYSPTTSKHRNVAREHAPKRGLIELTGLPLGMRADELREAGQVRAWVVRHRKEIDAVIRAEGVEGETDDDERESWLMNDEGLYRRAVDAGVPV